jgi:predicted pyridoxine 5'-phosphate oxidase superfamily flavin-nucleotide-binding protein
MSRSRIRHGDTAWRKRHGGRDIGYDIEIPHRIRHRGRDMEKEEDQDTVSTT